MSFQISLFIGALATAIGGYPLIETIFYAWSGFLLTCEMIWFLLGFETTGKLIMAVIEIIQQDIYPFGIIYMVAISGFTSAFFLLSPDIRLDHRDVNDDVTETPADTYAHLPDNSIILFACRFVETLFTGFTGTPSYYAYTDPNSQWFAQILSGLFLFAMPTLMLNLLIAIMNDRYSTVQNSSRSMWLLEISSIMSRFEMEILAMCAMMPEQDDSVNVGGDERDVDNTVSAKAQSQMNAGIKTRRMLRIDHEIDEFNLFTVLLGANHHAYVEVETANKFWNSTNARARSRKGLRRSRTHDDKDAEEEECCLCVPTVIAKPDG